MPYSSPATETDASNSQSANSYDQNADFWVQIIRGNRDRYRTGLTNSAVLESLGPVDGMRILDAGCGEGYLARELASRGASVLGVDSSRNLIEAAQSLVPADASSPGFEVQDVNDLHLDSGSFDLVVCNHLMNDLPDPTGPIREFSRVLRPGGRLAVLMLHPCFYGDRASRSDSDDQGPGLAYFSPRKVSQKFDVDGIVSPAEVTSYHRPLEFYISSFRQADLWITDLQEPHPTAAQLHEDPWWQVSFPRPIFLLLVAQKHDALPVSG
jgi:ubiquinone/menaquinone biosynthesis C-methylase UbiE